MSFGQLLPSTSPDSIFHYQFPRLPYFIHWRIIALQCYVGFCSSIQFSRAVVSDPATPWTAARQGSLSFTNSQSLLKPMSTESVMPTNHLIFCHPLLLLPSNFPSFRVFPMGQLFASSGQSIGVSLSKRSGQGDSITSE